MITEQFIVVFFPLNKTNQNSMRHELYLVQSLHTLSQFIGDKRFNKIWNIHILEAFQIVQGR